ncbi:hypothetical protein SCLCIDRAFT_27418 [Scleroderma citrinum Foug A]|uniref:Uncharacterized protein n=1 Tax=Scleroderma citrinum Foug A TaxID=1036808 RepID=A0A0C3DTM7_9AGAM|nr:hypothetical protein SCLCIDRAFT_27418 [Scleroderma citrinum Foug A]
MSSTWIPGPVRSLPLLPVLNPFITPPPAPERNTMPDRVATPDQPLPLRYPPSLRQPPPSPVQGKPDKGKGRQQATPSPPPTGSVDPSPVPTTSSANLTPEQHVCLVQVLKRLDEWFACGWEPRVDKSHLRSLAEIFNSAEAVAEGGIADLRLANLAWRLADSEGWEKSAGSSIMGAIDIQVTVTKILYKDYGDALIDSFRSFLGQREAELGNSGRPSNVAGPPFSQATSHRDSKPVVPKRKGMREADYLLKRRLPAFLRTMRRARLSPNISPLLAEHLTGGGETSCLLSASPLPELTPSARNTPLLRSLTPRSFPLQPVVNFDISSLAAEPLPITTPSEDIGAFDATLLDTGPATMTEIVNHLMEDLLTREFCPILLDEDI